MKNYNKVKAYIGFAMKSRKIVLGIDNILTHNPLKIKLIIVSDTLSDNAVGKLKTYAENANLPIKILSIDFYEILKLNNCKTVAIKDVNLAKAIIDNMD